LLICPISLGCIIGQSRFIVPEFFGAFARAVDVNVLKFFEVRHAIKIQ